MTSNILNKIYNFLSRKASKKDLREIADWSQKSEGNTNLFRQIEAVWNAVDIIENPENIDKKEAWEKVRSKIDSNKSKTLISKSTINTFLKIAALVVFILGTGAVTYFAMNRNKQQIELSQIEDFVKNSKKGQLILANGTVINLNEKDAELKYDSKSGNILFDSESILYEPELAEKGKAQLVYNQVIIPEGFRYQIVLSDGTKVWLNSESKFRYPVKFVKGDRSVYLEGEAFLSVTPNEHSPFFVITEDIQIEVLGTEFNVMAYPNEGTIETTLVKGAVSIKAGNPNVIIGEQVLKPEQRATFVRSEGKLKIEKNVDTELFTSWKEGYLKLKDETFENVTKKLSRNYGINITITDEDLKNLEISGKMELSNSIIGVIDNLQILISFKYRLEDNKIVITKEEGVIKNR